MRLIDFKGIRDLSLDVRTGDASLDEVLLLGANATGKTTIIEALALLLGQGKAKYSEADAQESLVRFGANDFRISAYVSTIPPHADGRRHRFPRN